MDPAKNPLDWLKSAGAQGDVVDGLSRFSTWETLWNECPRGDWLLGIATKLGVDHIALVKAAIGCARIVESDHDDASMRVLDLAEQWTEGRASIEDVSVATRGLEKSMNEAFDRGAEAAARACLAVGLGVSDRDVIPVAAAAAAESVILSSIDCGFELAMRWAHDKCASAVRKAVPWEAIAPCIARLGSTE